MPVSVFFSYSHADKPLARALVRSLQDQGPSVWIDEAELRAGDSVIQRLAAAVKAMDFLVALVSEHSVNSKWCQKELSLAMTHELNGKLIRVIPVRVGDVPLPETIEDKLYLTLDPSNVYPTVRQIVADLNRHGTDPSGRTVIDPMASMVAAARAASTGGSPAATLLRQYLAYFRAENYKACFSGWLKYYREPLAGATDEIIFWLHSFAAVSGARLGDARPAHIARFGGLADRLCDRSAPEQVAMVELIQRLYGGDSG